MQLTQLIYYKNAITSINWKTISNIAIILESSFNQLSKEIQ